MCCVNSAPIFLLICLPSPLFHNIKIFPAPMKVENELSRNLEFPEGKYLYIIMGPSLHTTENNTVFVVLNFIRWTKSWDLVPLFGNNIINIAWARCLHHRFSKYNQMVQHKMVSIIILGGLTESIGSLLYKISNL